MNHRLLCADATRVDGYRQLLDNELADMVVTDPPYNVNYQTTGSNATHRPIANDNLGNDFSAFLLLVCRHILISTTGAVYICMSSSQLHTLHCCFVEAGGHWSTFIIWGKNTFTLGRSDYQRQYEPILYGWPASARHYWCGARDQGDLWLIDKPHVNDLHPTMKPVGLAERAILNSSRRGNTVLDPFGGSGTTLIAAEKTGRKARLMEIDPLYCDTIIGRWQQYTGKQALHARTGQTFDELCAQRSNVVPGVGLLAEDPNVTTGQER
jgi:DNA modification methylase